MRLVTRDILRDNTGGEATGAGILYVATGRRYAAEAAHSLASVAAQMPGFPVAVATDLPGLFPAARVIPIEQPRRSFVDKIVGMLATPFADTLFLDTDTFLLRSVDHLFALLERFDVAAALEPA